MLLSDGAGDEWQAPIGCSSGGQGWSPLKYVQVSLDCKKIPFEYQSRSYPRYDRLSII